MVCGAARHRAAGHGMTFQLLEIGFGMKRLKYIVYRAYIIMYSIVLYIHFLYMYNKYVAYFIIDRVGEGGERKEKVVRNWA